MKRITKKYNNFTLVLFLTLLILLNIRAYGDIGNTPSHIQSLSVSSGTYNGNGTSWHEAYSSVQPFTGAQWIQLHFTNTTLGDGSYIEIISLEDNSIQYINARTLNEWKNASAFFNGDSLHIKLFVAATDSNIHFEIDKAALGDAVGSNCDEGCGDINLFTPRNNPRVGRVVGIAVLHDSLAQTGWGTAFIISGGDLVTAGHVYDALDGDFIVEFNVPLSDPDDGTLLHSLAIDQYRLQDKSKSFPNEEGNDWCVFTTFSTQNRIPFLAQGASYGIERTFPDTVNVTGYGCYGFDNYIIDNTLKGFQRTSKGERYGNPGWRLQYHAYTEPGMSGGPVVSSTDTNTVIGVHNYGCTGNSVDK
ncbi:MAG: trypsin-like peptidase domain-containing protein [Ignavibacteriae bacterium]|nr:trypsin-like peptidase domain-containing protein [Ignavibacteriota bacterium]